MTCTAKHRPARYAGKGTRFPAAHNTNDTAWACRRCGQSGRPRMTYGSSMAGHSFGAHAESPRLGAGATPTTARHTPTHPTTAMQLSWRWCAKVSSMGGLGFNFRDVFLHCVVNFQHHFPACNFQYVSSFWIPIVSSLGSILAFVPSFSNHFFHTGFCIEIHKY